MEETVLNTVKKLLGIDNSVDAFDADILPHINSALLTLEQIGVELKTYFLEDGTESWSMLTDDALLSNRLKTYIYLKVRLLFDPPSSSFVLDSIVKNIQELEWRLNVQAKNG